MKKFFLTERKREGENKGEPDILAAQIHRAKWDEEEEEKEERQETKRWRGTKNSITGLALTLTFIWQSDTLSLVSLVQLQERPALHLKLRSTRVGADFQTRRRMDLTLNSTRPLA